MVGKAYDFEAILHPLDPNAFLKEHWQKHTHLVARGNPEFYSDLFGLADVDSAVQLACLKSSDEDVRMVKTENGESVDRTVPRASDETPDIYALYQGYNAGYTIIINRLHVRWKAISALCRNLEESLHHSVGANLYLTPRNSQGFAPHFDTHDVFILQLAGSKRWLLYDCVTVPDAHRRVQRDELGPPKQDLFLEAGDLLYIPRGHIHEAVSTNFSSLHLTVGIEFTRWIDLLKKTLLAAAEENAKFHEALPIGFLRSDQAVEQVKRGLAELLSGLPWEEYATRAVRQFSDRLYQRGYPAPDGHFWSLCRVDAIDLETIVERRSGLVCSTFVQDGSCGIQYPGNQVIGPITIEPALEFVSMSRRFAVKDLPGLLDGEEKLVLVRRLVREGLLRVASLD